MKFAKIADGAGSRCLSRPTGPAAWGVRHPRRRGMALLLVMIGMIVCTILTAGFLATQGTSLGIARNERDAEKCRVLAQTGIDMCYWLVRNKSDWRETMPIGNWLSALPVGDGTVTVSVQDGDNTGSFSDDPTQGIVLTSSGVYDNRNFTLTATIRPTGGGTVFSDGNFIQGNILLGNTNLLTAATIDSYNSSVAPYNSLFPGSNAIFGSNSLASNALTVYFPSVFRGSYLAGPLAAVTSVLNLVGLGASGPASVTAATEARIPGTVVDPNVAGLPYQGAFNKPAGSLNPFPGPGRYDSASASGTANINITSSGLYYITGNLSISAPGASLVIADGVSAVVMVDGNVTVNGKITLSGSAQLALYCNNPVTVSGGSINFNGVTNRFTLMGGPNCTQIQMISSSTVAGSIFAPQAAFLMSSGANKLYGAIIANSLSITSTGQLHFDQALQSLYISNITGGSAPPGTADYRLTLTGGPGFSH